MKIVQRMETTRHVRPVAWIKLTDDGARPLKESRVEGETDGAIMDNPCRLLLVLSTEIAIKIGTKIDR